MGDVVHDRLKAVCLQGVKALGFYGLEARPEAVHALGQIIVAASEMGSNLIDKYGDALAEIRAHGDPWSSRKAKEALGEVVDATREGRAEGGSEE